MKLYWTMHSVPELRDLPRAERRRVWQAAWRVDGRMSLGEIATLGLAIAIGAQFGPLGIGLCIGIVAVPVQSRVIERLRPTLLVVRQKLALDTPSPHEPEDMRKTKGGVFSWIKKRVSGNVRGAWRAGLLLTSP